MTFKGIRTQAQRIYKETSEAVSKREKEFEKLKSVGIYTPAYIQKAESEKNTEIRNLWATAATELQGVVKPTIEGGRSFLDAMLSKAPTTDQINLLTALQLQGANITKEEAASIANSLVDNYRASFALKGIVEKAGFVLHLDPTKDHKALIDAMNRVESYLKDRTHELKNFNGWMKAHPWFRMFFGEGWSDGMYGPDADLLDAAMNGGSIPEGADDHIDMTIVEKAIEDSADDKEGGAGLSSPKTIGRILIADDSDDSGSSEE